MSNDPNTIRKAGRPGKRAGNEAKAQAEYLFINTDMTQGRIAEIVGVTEKTLSLWVNENGENWKIARAAKSITRESIIAQLHLQLYNLNEAISFREEGARFPSSTEADTQSKIAANIERLDKKNNVALYISAMEEFAEFLSKRDAKAAQTLAMHMLEFVKHKSSKLNGN